jgi:metallophosphoesterase superfamily enzyme
MRNLSVYTSVPNYHGKRHIKAKLPSMVRDWSHGMEKSVTNDDSEVQKVIRHISDLNRHKAWKWPKKRIFFFSDLHADAAAFSDSLVASGGIRRTGKNPRNFELTKEGNKATFIIGGDCFDKGPSTLELLRTIRHLMKLGASVHILAGNHDVRVLLGMMAVDMKKDRFNEHFFIRTGQKIIPLLKEVCEKYVGKKFLAKMPSNQECRKRLFPSAGWFKAFPEIARDTIRPAQIKRELTRIRKKHDRFESLCQENGMNMRDVYAAVEVWKKLFIKSSGEFYWFYNEMKLAMRAGSLLFIHAGVDNKTARHLYRGGVKALNKGFAQALKHKPFSFYYGPLCNMVRTKYRDVDHPLTAHGTRLIRRAGISAVIHGHRNLHNGQRIALRKSMLNFECDTSMDQHTRHQEGLTGKGAGVTIIDPGGHILAISSDYPYAKLFEPEMTLKQLKKSLNRKRRAA